MHRDYLGNPVSVGSADSLAAIDDFVEGYLSYETRAEAIIAAADAAPDCCLANAYAGFLWMLLEAPDAARHAGRYLAAAAGAPLANARERLHVAVLRAWIADDIPATLRWCDRISDEFPHDLAIVKTHQYLEFNRGNFTELLRVALKVLPANPGTPYLQGMIAFGYEQCHLLEEAESAARAALSLRRKDPWAQHALAHVMLTRGQIEAGAAFLEGESPTWTGLNSFMVTHIWWHLALFYLSQGRNREVLHIFDAYCWNVAKNYSQDQIGAVSLLARMEIAGIDVGTRWQDLGEHLAGRAADTVQPFLTLQYLYGLARAGRAETDTLLDAVRQAALTAPAHSRELWAEVALPAGEGLVAYARGDLEPAWRRLGQAMPRMIEIGGSHAQRDLFEQILLDIAIRGGRFNHAQQALELRRGSDPDGVPVNLALARIYTKLGLPDLAVRAQARASATAARSASRIPIFVSEPRSTGP